MHIEAFFFIILSQNKQNINKVVKQVENIYINKFYLSLLQYIKIYHKIFSFKWFNKTLIYYLEKDQQVKKFWKEYEYEILLKTYLWNNYKHKPFNCFISRIYENIIILIK